MDCIILAGGKGLRMETELPKALVKVRGKPILDWQLDYLLPHMDNVILAVGEKSAQIKEHVQKNHSGKNILFSIEEKPLGTGGAIKHALEKTTSEWVLILNSDDISNISLEACQKIRENTIFVIHPRLPFGLVREKGGYAHFEEKPILDEWVSSGWYVLNRAELLEKLPNMGSIEYETFPRMKLRVGKHTGFWHPLNSPKDVAEFETRNDAFLTSSRPGKN